MEASTNTVKTYPAAGTRVDRAARKADYERTLPQLSFGRTIAIWAAAAVPMGVLAWLVAPLLSDQLSGPSPLIQALLITLTAGLVWQFALVMILVKREQGNLRFSTLRDALWLRAPRSPRSGRRGGRIWLIAVPLVLATAVEGALALPAVSGRDFFEFLDSNAGEALLGGSWGWFALIAVLVTFNTVLGEEFLFRGYLLPRMNGVFGERDWIANGVLFAVYHLHMPWVIPTGLLDTFILSYPAKRYRSTLMAIVIHSAQSVLVLGLVLSLVLKG